MDGTSQDVRGGGSSTPNLRCPAPTSESTTHRNPALQNLDQFPCFKDGDVVISLSPAASDTLFLHSDKLSAFSDIFRAGLADPWSFNKIAGVRKLEEESSKTMNEVPVKRYELDFAHDSEEENDGNAILTTDFIIEYERLSLEDTAGSESRDEIEDPDTPMLVGKVSETPRTERLLTISSRVSHDYACRIILTYKIAFALMYDQRIEFSYLSPEHAPIIINEVMNWLDLYICSRTAQPTWAGKLSAAVLSSKENVMRNAARNPFPWLLAGFKVRSTQIYQVGLRYAVGHYLRWRRPDCDLMLHHLDGEQLLLDIVEKEAQKISKSVRRLQKNLRLLAAECSGNGLKKHVPPWLKHSQTQKDANVLWVYWLRTVLLKSDDEPCQGNWAGMNDIDFGSHFSEDMNLEKRPKWLLPKEARRVEQGEVHEEELIEVWKAYTKSTKDTPSVSYDDALRRELVKILVKARHRVQALFRWYPNSTTTLNERDDEAFDTYRCVDFRNHAYPWNSESPWSIYTPMVGLQDNSKYWTRVENYDYGSDEGGWGGNNDYDDYDDNYHVYEYYYANDRKWYISDADRLALD